MSTVELPTSLTPLILRGHVLDVLRTLPDESVDCFVTSSPYWGARRYGACSCSIQRHAGTGFGEYRPNEAPGTHGGIDPSDPRCRRDPDPECPVCHGAGLIPGVGDQIWGGKRECDHHFTSRKFYTINGGARSKGENYAKAGPENARRIKDARWVTDASCETCGAWKGEYGSEPTPWLFIEHSLEWCAEAARVIKPTGSLWYNIGDSSIGSGRGPTGKNGLMNHSDRQKMWDSGSNGPQFKGDGILKPKDLALIPERILIGLQEAGWTVRDKVIWAKPNPARSSAKDRLARSWEPVYRLTRGPDYYFDEEAGRQPYSLSTLREVDVAYRNQSTKMYERQKAQDPSDTKRRIIAKLRERGGSMLTDVWCFATASYRGNHTATFPETLPRLCILLTTKPGDIVCDPFAGTGTTLMEARRLGRRSIGIEISQESVAEIEKRTDQVHPTIDTFTHPIPVPPSEAEPGGGAENPRSADDGSGRVQTEPEVGG